MGAGDLVFRGVVGALGIVTAGSLVWFSATGVRFEFGSNTHVRSHSRSTPSFVRFPGAYRGPGQQELEAATRDWAWDGAWNARWTGRSLSARRPAARLLVYVSTVCGRRDGRSFEFEVKFRTPATRSWARSLVRRPRRFGSWAWAAGVSAAGGRRLHRRRRRRWRSSWPGWRTTMRGCISSRGSWTRGCTTRDAASQIRQSLSKGWLCTRATWSCSFHSWWLRRLH